MAPAGTYTLTFSASGLGTVTSQTFQVVAGAATQLVVTTQPSPAAISGQPLAVDPIIWAEDSGGNLSNPTVNGTVTVSASANCNPTPTPSTATMTNSQVTFSALTMTLTSNTPNSSCTLTFSMPSLSSVTSSVFMSFAPAAIVQTATLQSTAYSGTPLTPQPVIVVKDLNGTVVKAINSGTVTASLVAPVPATASLDNATATFVNGQASFSGLAINGTAQNYSLSFSYTYSSSPTFTTTAGPIALATGAQYKLTILRQPSPTAQSGVALAVQPQVQVLDSGGNAVTNSTATISATISAGGVSVTNYTAVAVNGLATFSGLALNALVGSYTLTFSSYGLQSATSSAIALSVGLPSQLVITTPPSPSAATGVALAVQPVVKVEDSGGNVVSTSYATVTASLNGTSTGTLVRNTANALAGVASFLGLTITAPVGSYTLTFSAPGLTSAVSGTISVTSGPAAKLVITGLPSSVAQSGVALAVQPVVSVEDAAGNVVTSDASTVTARISVGGVSLSNGAKTALNGVAAFSGLAINALVGTYTLTFTDGALSPAVSASITVSLGPASQLVITQEPSPIAQSGVAMSTQPVVKVEDSGGNVVTSVNSGQVIAAVGAGVAGAVTAGSSANIAYGVAAFSGLAITGTTGAHYQLVFTGVGFSILDTQKVTIGQAQAALSLTTRKGWLGRTLVLKVTGGSGTGAVSFSIVSPGTTGCSIVGNVLHYSTLGTCTVVVTKAASGVYQPITTGPTAIVIALLPKPGVLSLGFGPVARALNAGQARALARLTTQLTTRSLVRVVAYAPRNIPLARARGEAVMRFLSSRLHLRVQLILSTHTAANVVHVITIAQ